MPKFVQTLKSCQNFARQTSFTVFRFRWRSWRVGYALCVVVAVLVRMMLSVPEQVGYLDLLGDIAAHSFAIAIIVLYFRLAKRWRNFSLMFLKIEKNRSSYVGNPHLTGIGRRMRTITILFFSFAFVEHSFDRISLITATVIKYKYSSIKHLFEDTLLQRSFLEALATVSSLLSATYMGFIFVFNDVFIILVSVYVSKRIEDLNNHLRPAMTKAKDRVFWENARLSFDEVSKLSRDIDSYINPNILVTFAQNLFFICFQLLYFLDETHDGYLRSLFRGCSFCYVLLRTYAVSYFAASINDQSKLARTLLFSVSSRSYCTEVYRFLMQAANEEMALTGCNFFRVTRAFILTVAGTIATYEVILLQMNKS